MSVTVEDFNPTKPVLFIDNTPLTLNLISLKMSVIITETYGGIPEVYATIEKDPLEFVKVMWLLLEDKARFKNIYNNFYEFVFSSKESSDKWAKRMNDCLNSCVIKSNPLIKNAKRAKAIRDVQAVSGEKPCYVKYFDKVGKRYGFSIDDFYDLTVRQLQMLLKNIGDKEYDELGVQASLVNKKLQPRMKYEEISEEEDLDNEAEAQDTLRTLQENYKKQQEAKNGE